MSDHRDVLERGLHEFRAPELPYEAILQRRDRHRRNQRIAAAVVGAVAAALLIVGVLAGVRALDRSKGTTPALPSDPPILRQGEVLEMADDAMTFLATNTETGEQRTLARCHDCAYVYRVEASADGTWLAYHALTCGGGCQQVEPGAGLWVVGAHGARIHVTTSGGYVWDWSPTTEQIAFADGGEAGSHLLLLDPATGERTPIVTTEGGIAALAWSPDGSTIAYASTEPSGIFVVRPGGTPERIGDSSIRLCCDAENGAENLVWSPDGSRLASSAHGYGVSVMRIDGSGELKVLDQQPNHIAWSPDGRLVAYLGGHDVGVVPASGGSPLILVHTDRRLWGDVAWSPTGRFVAFRPGDYWWIRRWYVVPADGSGGFEDIDRLDDIDRIDRLEAERWSQR
jgi:Tol biopolymer transport system component